MAPNQSSTEQTFRANLSQFRWANSIQDDSQPAQASNPFARFYNAIGGGYIPLRSGERSNEEEAYFALSRWDRCASFAFPFSPTSRANHLSFIYAFYRLLGFGACLLGAAVCFFVAFLTAPLIPIRPAKFALALRFALISSLSLFILIRLILPSFQPGQRPGDVRVCLTSVPCAHLCHLPTRSS